MYPGLEKHPCTRSLLPCLKTVTVLTGAGKILVREDVSRIYVCCLFFFPGEGPG